jgi:ribulose-5-phosphate 4-epimerase/fuculose-1-phosphate aldolase
MAGAFRIFASEGYAEGISGHISVRDPEFVDRFWINPLGVHFGMLKASDMVCVDLEGKLCRR